MTKTPQLCVAPGAPAEVAADIMLGLHFSGHHRVSVVDGDGWPLATLGRVSAAGQPDRWQVSHDLCVLPSQKRVLDHALIVANQAAVEEHDRALAAFSEAVRAAAARLPS